MEPIVSPWLIYLLGLVEPINGILFGVCTFSIVGAIIFVVSKIVYVIYKEAEYNGDKRCSATANRVAGLFKRTLYVFPLMLILAVAMPSRNTLIGMIVAKQITPNNVKVAVQAGKDFKDEVKKDVLDIIMAVTKDKEKPEAKK